MTEKNNIEQTLTLKASFNRHLHVREFDNDKELQIDIDHENVYLSPNQIDELISYLVKQMKSINEPVTVLAHATELDRVRAELLERTNEVHKLTSIVDYQIQLLESKTMTIDCCNDTILKLQIQANNQ